MSTWNGQHSRSLYRHLGRIEVSTCPAMCSRSSCTRTAIAGYGSTLGTRHPPDCWTALLY